MSKAAVIEAVIAMERTIFIRQFFRQPLFFITKTILLRCKTDRCTRTQAAPVCFYFVKSVRAAVPYKFYKANSARQAFVPQRISWILLPLPQHHPRLLLQQRLRLRRLLLLRLLPLRPLQPLRHPLAAH